MDQLRPGAGESQRVHDGLRHPRRPLTGRGLPVEPVGYALGVGPGESLAGFTWNRLMWDPSRTRCGTINPSPGPIVRSINVPYRRGRLRLRSLGVLSCLRMDNRISRHLFPGFMSREMESTQCQHTIALERKELLPSIESKDRFERSQLIAPGK